MAGSQVAAQLTALVSVALLGCAFVVTFWLPRRVRQIAPASAGDRPSGPKLERGKPEPATA